MGILEKISEIEREIARTQKNKGNLLIYCSQSFCYEFHAEVINTFFLSSKSHHFYYIATEYHLGLLKAKLAKYRSELLEPSKKGEKGEGFDVLKSGDARVALIGFPSVGKVTIFWFFIILLQ